MNTKSYVNEYVEVRRKLSELIIDHPKVLLLGGSGYAQSENVEFENWYCNGHIEETQTIIMHLTEYFATEPNGFFIVRSVILEKNGFTLESRKKFQLTLNLAKAVGNQAGMLRGVIRIFFIDNALEGL